MNPINTKNSWVYYFKKYDPKINSTMDKLEEEGFQFKTTIDTDYCRANCLCKLIVYKFNKLAA